MSERHIVIHKFVVQRFAWQTVEVVGYLDKLDIQKQGDDLVMWCTVMTPATEAVPLRLYIAGTGTPIAENVSSRTYWRTVQDGRYVWHIFLQEGVRA